MHGEVPQHTPLHPKLLRNAAAIGRGDRNWPHLMRVLPDEGGADKLEYAPCLPLRAIQLLRTVRLR